MNPRPIYENSEQLDQSLDQLLDELAWDQLEQEQRANDSAIPEQPKINNPQLTLEDIQCSEEDKKIMEEVYKNPEISVEIAPADNTPITISEALSQLRETKRCIVEIKVNSNMEQEIHNLRRTFNGISEDWQDYRKDYRLICNTKVKHNIYEAYLIPYLDVYSAFSLSQQIINTRSIKKENICFYEMPHMDVVVDENFLHNYNKYTYDSYKQDIKNLGYMQLQIQYLKYNKKNKYEFENSLISFLKKYKDLNYKAIYSPEERQGSIIGNDASNSLNTFNSLRVINDELVRLSKKFSIDISITMSKTPFDFGTKIILKNTNKKRINSINDRNVQTVTSEPSRKKQRVAKPSPPIAHVQNQSILTNLSIFQNMKMSADLSIQLQKIISKTNM